MIYRNYIIPKKDGTIFVGIAAGKAKQMSFIGRRRKRRRDAERQSTGNKSSRNHFVPNRTEFILM